MNGYAINLGMTVVCALLLVVMWCLLGGTGSRLANVAISVILIPVGVNGFINSVTALDRVDLPAFLYHGGLLLTGLCGALYLVRTAVAWTYEYKHGPAPTLDSVAVDPRYPAVLDGSQRVYGRNSQ